MSGIVAPAANVVFDSVTTTSSADGIEERAPRTIRSGTRSANSAAALVESGNLLMHGATAPSTVETGSTMSRAMMEAGRCPQGREAKNPEGILAAGETINVSCDNCHEKYQRQ